MAENAVTHEMLRAGQLAMLDRFTAHEKRFDDMTTRLFEKVDDASAAAHSNSLQIAQLQGSVTSMMEGRTGHLDRLESAEASIRTLEKSEAFKAGERGVLAAILRSPFVMAVFGALAGAAAAIWAAAKSIAASAATP